MIVKIFEIKDALNKIFDHMEKQGKTEIDINHDYYWDISLKQRYDPYITPPNLDLGQLSSDLEDIRKINQGDMPPITYSLTYLASIILYIGEQELLP